MDFRLSFFVETIAKSFDVTYADVVKSLGKKDIIDLFLKNQDCLSLIAEKCENSVYFSNTIIDHPQKRKDNFSVIFLKHPNSKNLSDQTLDGLKSSIVIIHSSFGVNVQALLNATIQSLYLNTKSNDGHGILDDKKTKKTASKKINNFLHRLLPVLSSDNTSDVVCLPEYENTNAFTPINLPSDEVIFWEKKQNETDLQEAAEQITNYLKESINAFLDSTYNRDIVLYEDTPKKKAIGQLNKLSRNFSHGGCIETTLIHIFQVSDSEGKYVYSSKVSDIETIERCRDLIIFMYYGQFYSF